MNLGQLEEENEQFVRQYKKLGYSTRTQLVSDAISLLREKKERDRRQQWLKLSFEQLKDEKPDYAFSDIDGDEFLD